MPGGSYSTSQGDKLRTCFVLLTHRPELAELVGGSRRPGQLPLELEDTLNKSLNASAFTRSQGLLIVPSPSRGGLGCGRLPGGCKAVGKQDFALIPAFSIKREGQLKDPAPSFLRRQEPRSTTFQVPAFAGTTGRRDKHPGHGLIQRFLNASDWPL